MRARPLGGGELESPAGRLAPVGVGGQGRTQGLALQGAITDAITARRVGVGVRAVLGGGEEDMGAEEDLGVEDEMMGADMDGEEDEQAIGDDEPMGEEIEAEVLGEPIVKQNMKGSGWIGPKGKNNVVDSTASKLAKPGKGGDSKVTDKVGDDGTEGHPLVNQKKGTDLIGPKHKNTVKSVTTSKVGDTFFQPA